MKPHPYLRAYLAGIAVPTVFLFVAIAIYAVVRFGTSIALPPVERIIMFPMAVVPNLWGGWNMVRLALHNRVRMPLGLHGAVLVVFIAPAGLALARAFDVVTVSPATVLGIVPIGMAIYYLVWQHIVGFLNDLVGIE